MKFIYSLVLSGAVFFGGDFFENRFAEAGGVRNYGLFFATVPLISLTTFTLIWSAFQEPAAPQPKMDPQASMPKGFEKLLGVDRCPTTRACGRDGLAVAKVVNVSR